MFKTANLQSDQDLKDGLSRTTKILFMKLKILRERYKLLKAVDKLLEGPMIFLGFVWLGMLIIELVWGSNKTIEFATLAIWFVFIIDFIVKLILAPEKIKYFKSNWLTVISLLIPALRVLRLFRFFQAFRALSGIRLVRIISSLNRSLRSLGATMQRRAFGYVFILILIVCFAGAAGMFAFENHSRGFETYGMALWWTAMKIITASNEFYPATSEGRSLGFLIAVFGYTIFGYVTAAFASFFIGSDAEEHNAPVAGTKDIQELKKEISVLTRSVNTLINSKQ